jgi:hypothetical protein
MSQLSFNTKGKILFPTNHYKYPFLIKVEDDLYLLVREDGSLTGDAFYRNEIIKHFPKTELDAEVRPATPEEMLTPFTHDVSID